MKWCFLAFDQQTRSLQGKIQQLAVSALTCIGGDDWFAPLVLTEFSITLEGLLGRDIFVTSLGGVPMAWSPAVGAANLTRVLFTAGISKPCQSIPVEMDFSKLEPSCPVSSSFSGACELPRLVV